MPTKAADPLLADARLANLIAITEGQEPDLDAVILDRDLIDPDPEQPRLYFPEEELTELGEDMRQHKLKPLHPLIVRPHPLREGRFMLVAGEMRWRASGVKYGDIERLRCTLRELTDEEVALIQGAENEKRKDVSAIAKGRNYRRLKKVLSHQGAKGADVSNMANANGDAPEVGWKEVAEKVGKAQITVLRHVRLLRLPKEVQEYLERHKMSEKHGRAFLDLQESGQGLAGPDLSNEKPNKMHRRLLGEIKELSGDAAIERAQKIKDEAEGKPAKPATPAAATTTGAATTGQGTTDASSGTSHAPGAGVTATTGQATGGSGISTGRTPAATAPATPSTTTEITPEPAPLPRWLETLKAVEALVADAIVAMSDQEFPSSESFETVNAQKYLQRAEDKMRIVLERHGLK